MSNPGVVWRNHASDVFWKMLFFVELLTVEVTRNLVTSFISPAVVFGSSTTEACICMVYSKENNV